MFYRGKYVTWVCNDFFGVNNFFNYFCNLIEANCQVEHELIL